MPQADPFRDPPKTLSELIDAGEDYLVQHNLVYGHGTDNAYDEAAWLAIEACGQSPVGDVQDTEITDAQLEIARAWFTKRAVQKIPVAYLTGRGWFAGLEFIVDERALVPRSPIAELIANSFTPWISRPPTRILDVCCGGGCIAIAIAKQFGNCPVDAVDLSPDALALAQENVRKHEVSNLVSLHEGDLLEPIEPSNQYDLIVSNPPYVDARDMSTLAAEFQREPRMGLVAGDDGLDIVDRLLKQAKDYLKPNGVLIVEVGNSKQAADKRYEALPLVWLELEHGGDGVFAVMAEDLPDGL